MLRFHVITLFINSLSKKFWFFSCDPELLLIWLQQFALQLGKGKCAFVFFLDKYYGDKMIIILF